MTWNCEFCSQAEFGGQLCRGTKSRLKSRPCRLKFLDKLTILTFGELCFEVFSTEWAMISHSTLEHGDLHEIYSLISKDISKGWVLTDIQQNQQNESVIGSESIIHDFGEAIPSNAGSGLTKRAVG